VWAFNLAKARDSAGKEISVDIFNFTDGERDACAALETLADAFRRSSFLLSPLHAPQVSIACPIPLRSASLLALLLTPLSLSASGRKRPMSSSSTIEGRRTGFLRHSLYTVLHRAHRLTGSETRTAKIYNKIHSTESLFPSSLSPRGRVSPTPSCLNHFTRQPRRCPSSSFLLCLHIRVSLLSELLNRTLDRLNRGLLLASLLVELESLRKMPFEVLMK
jgi:hypothetical protein